MSSDSNSDSAISEISIGVFCSRLCKSETKEYCRPLRLRYIKHAETSSIRRPKSITDVAKLFTSNEERLESSQLNCFKFFLLETIAFCNSCIISILVDLFRLTLYLSAIDTRLLFGILPPPIIRTRSLGYSTFHE